jgi:2-keto-4-pentenoate hydratase/2-oxohepta-3-ene-1,7-dioic acid hydratase in catechol pathway
MQESIKTTRRQVLAGALATSLQASAQPRKYVRFRKGARSSYGLLEGDTIHELRGDLFAGPAPTGSKHKLSEVKLLYPVTPTKILALAGNYRSHMGGHAAPSSPEAFYKPVSCLLSPEEPIVFPKGATVVHPECELVIVIGKRASNITVGQAKEAIFGVTCGNDVSEREWQNGAKKDIQWWRAKGADTFGPLGPAIVTGIDYGNLEIQSRINGKVIQKDSTSQLVHDCPTVVSYLSQFVTLLPGDLIFTGTPGKTSRMDPGDVVEVEIQGIGVLRNKITAG